MNFLRDANFEGLGKHIFLQIWLNCEIQKSKIEEDIENDFKELIGIKNFLNHLRWCHEKYNIIINYF